MTPERATDGETRELLDAAGIVVTDEGKERARQRLADADARMTPDRWADLRTKLGVDAA